jgi:hypothetical protein
MTRKSLSELFRGHAALPSVTGIVDAVLRDSEGNILQHVHQYNMVTEYFRLLFAENSSEHDDQYVFINETSEAMHVKRNSLRTTLPGTWYASVSPTIDGASRLWTYQTVFAVPPAERTIRMIGLARNVSTVGYTNLKSGPASISAATLLTTPIVQGIAATLEVSYRLAFQRN